MGLGKAMATRNKTGRHVDDRGVLRDEWLKVLSDLMAKVKNWAEELNWSTRLIAKNMKDSRLGEYEAPALLMQKETTRVLVDPIARFTPGADGVVDLYLLPAYDDIASLYLVHGDGDCTTCSRVRRQSRQSASPSPSRFPRTRSVGSSTK